MPASSLASRNDKSMQDRLLIMWTKEEDDILRDQVKVHGIDKWAKIATHLCSKTSRQCRRRWLMFLNVVNKRGGWSADEDKLLLEAHRKFGNRWTEIAKMLPGRTDNAVKNRFCVLCKKQTKEVEVSPLQSRTERGSDIAKQRLPFRRLLEGTKAMLGSGASKKMRMEANHNRKPEVVLQHTCLEEKLQQWKELQSSEILTPHLLSKEGNVRSWHSKEPTVLLHNTQEDGFQGWMGLAVGTGMSSVSCPQEQLRQTFQDRDGYQSGAGNNDLTCSTSSMQGETTPAKILQSHIPTISSSGHSRLPEENLQQRKTNMGDVSSADRLHHQRMVKSTHFTWCKARTTVSANNLAPQQRPDNEFLQWREEVDKNMSNIALHQMGIGETLHHWEQNFPDSVTPSHDHQRSIDENLPPSSEMNSLAAVYMTNSKPCALVSGMQRWTVVQPEKQGEHVQRSRAGGTQTWDHSLAKEANDTSTSKENMTEWQDWNSNEVRNYPPCRDRSLEHIMEIDDPKPDDSAESISFQESLKTLPLWTSPSCQQGKGSTVLHRSDGDETKQWNRSETPTHSPLQLMEDKMQQWQKSEGSNSKVTTQFLSPLGQGHGRYKSKITEDSWKTQATGDQSTSYSNSARVKEFQRKLETAVEKLKFTPTTFTANAKPQSPRAVLGFEEYMSGGSKDSDLETKAASAVTNCSQSSKVDDTKWELPINVKDGEDGEVNTTQGVLPKHNAACEVGIDVFEEPNDKVKSTTIEEEASQVTESPTPHIQTNGAHLPTQIVPRSHVTMECMPSPQFSDSEKEFLLSTLALAQATPNCWCSPPLRPPSRLTKVRNRLFDTRSDTPACSHISSCLLHQFQVPDAPNLT